jgi:hypothetical protein
MNMKLDPKMSGLAVGAFLGGLHLFWSILVALGWAQSLINFIFWAHMLRLPLAVNAFDIGAAVTLVIMSSAMGYILGCIFALAWNKLHSI